MDITSAHLVFVFMSLRERRPRREKVWELGFGGGKRGREGRREGEMRSDLRGKSEEGRRGLDE